MSQSFLSQSFHNFIIDDTSASLASLKCLFFIYLLTHWRHRDANTFTITVNSCDLGHVFRPVKLELLFKSNFGAHRVVAIVFSSLRLLLKCGSSFYVHSSSAQIVTRDGRIWYYDGLALVNANLNV
jgi:hypothetical protein